MRPLWLCLLLFTTSLYAAQTVHRWVDAQGNVHFSDQPSQQHNSELIEVTPPKPSSPVARRPTNAQELIAHVRKEQGTSNRPKRKTRYKD